MAESMFESSKTAAVNGTSLAYCEQGEGQPVVFVHGTASDMRIWAPQLPVIGQSYRAIAYSRRFARPNDDIAPDADDQMMPHVEDLAAFLRQIGADPAHLVGSSWGAFICLLTAIRYPDLVRSLVLEEPPLLPLLTGAPPRLGRLLSLFATRPRTALAFLRFAAGAMVPAQKAFVRGEDEQAMELFLIGVLGKEAYEQLPEASRQMMRENLSSARAQLLGAGFPPLGDDQVRGMRAPTLLITGEHSPAFLLRLTDRLEELLPIVERIEIPDASHVVHEDNPTAVNEAILAFIRRQADNPTSSD